MMLLLHKKRESPCLYSVSASPSSPARPRLLHLLLLHRVPPASPTPYTIAIFCACHSCTCCDRPAHALCHCHLPLPQLALSWQLQRISCSREGILWKPEIGQTLCLESLRINLPISTYLRQGKVRPLRMHIRKKKTRHARKRLIFSFPLTILKLRSGYSLCILYSAKLFSCPWCYSLLSASKSSRTILQSISNLESCCVVCNVISSRFQVDLYRITPKLLCVVCIRGL